jgi:hypothetical protein
VLYSISASDISSFLSSLLDNKGKLLKSLTNRINGTEKTGLFGWFDKILQARQSEPPLSIDKSYEITRCTFDGEKVRLNLFQYGSGETRREIVDPFGYVEFEYHGERIAAPAITFVGGIGSNDEYLYDYKYKESVDFASLSEEEKDALFYEFVRHYVGQGIIDQLTNPIQLVIMAIIGFLSVASGGTLATVLFGAGIALSVIDGAIGIYIIDKAWEMKKAATSIRQLKLSAEYFAEGVTKLGALVLDLIALTWAKFRGGKKLDVDEAVNIRQNSLDEVVDTPTAHRQTEFTSSYDMRIKNTPAPSNLKLEFIRGNRGETLCTLKPPPDPELKRILDAAGIEGIQYKNGVPDFSPVSVAEVEIVNMNKGRYGKLGNFRQADQALADKINESPELSAKFGLPSGNVEFSDIAKYRSDKNLVWHELNNVKTVQLVPSEINDTFLHLGGVGEINRGAIPSGTVTNK